MSEHDGRPGLQAAFDTLSGALAGGDLEGFYGLMHEDAMIVDEDIPFLGGKAAFQDHIAWHVSGIWEAFQWYPRQAQVICHGDTGAVVGYATFRGKPRDAGFRQRHMFFSQGWAREQGRWVLVNWHQSTLDGHILDASPG